MGDSSITYINFAHCELEGKWEQVNEEIHSDEDIFESLEDGAIINVRMFSEKKTRYFLKKGARIIIKDHVLKFNKADFSN